MTRYTLSLLLMLLVFTVYSQSVVGVWKTIDDDDGVEKSHVEIYEQGGKYFGKIIKTLDPTIPEMCGECKGDLKDTPMIGLQILNDLKKDGDEWTGGKILDPANGKIYKCKMSLESADVLNVRGFIGFSLIGRTQQWYRVK